VEKIFCHYVEKPNEEYCALSNNLMRHILDAVGLLTFYNLTLFHEMLQTFHWHLKKYSMNKRMM